MEHRGAMIHHHYRYFEKIPSCESTRGKAGVTYTAVVPFDDAKATLEAGPNHRILGSIG
jgi:hypothetical protein